MNIIGCETLKSHDGVNSFITKEYLGESKVQQYFGSTCYFAAEIS